MARDHAVVIGGSFAGLAAARALSDTFEKVTIIDRDDLEAPGNGPRRGVPQSAHVHGIRMLGRAVMEELMPGFVNETLEQGARLFDVLSLGANYTPFGWWARGTTQAGGYGIRRVLLESVARRRILALGNVDFVCGQAAELLRVGDRIGGVSVLTDGGTRSLDADLTVDASGKGSSAPGWLEKAGFTPPDEDIINGYVGYASQLVKVPEDAWPGDMQFVSQLPWPGQTKGAILYPQDNGLHILTLFGHSRDYPPGDEEGYKAFMQGCKVPLFYDLWSKSEPASGIATSRSTANRMRHYTRLSDPPAGFIALGDAVASFNPIFGQGITCSLLGGRLLRDLLTEFDDLAVLPKRFNDDLARMLVAPWHTATDFDLSFPETVGPRRTLSTEEQEFANYRLTLAQMATVDVSVAEAIQVAEQMFDPALLLVPELQDKARQFAQRGTPLPVSDPLRPPAFAA